MRKSASSAHLLLDEERRQPVEVEDKVFTISLGIQQDRAHANHLGSLLQSNNSCQVRILCIGVQFPEFLLVYSRLVRKRLSDMIGYHACDTVKRTRSLPLGIVKHTYRSQLGFQCHEAL